ncbi:MAG TPA: sulfite oxidase [Desulfobacteria bacterium]|nr:sulfite oxidase [Desulfobacteria bacterium]
MQSQTQQEKTDKPGLIPRQAMPENLESPITTIQSWITPNDLFYLRNHLGYPNISSDNWSLAANGEVSNPLTLSLTVLQKMPQVSKFVTIECSGNKRGAMLPNPVGHPWQLGAVGNAKWTGVPLTYLLDQVGLKDNVQEIIFIGSDTGTRPDLPQTVHFARSLPAKRELLNECILALKMNDEPIPFKHGAPLRLIVPGWYGMAHVKWLNTITASAKPFRGPFQSVDYVYVTNPDDYRDAVPVREIKVNSIITWPSQGIEVPVNTHVVRGLAWTGTGTIAKVEVSVDNGATWAEAKLTSPEYQPYTWTFWEFPWAVKATGQYLIKARAYDTAGNIQPMVAPWNLKGYGNNSIHQVAVNVPKLPNIQVDAGF